MKKSRTTFLIAEILLGILAILLVRNMFAAEKPPKRVAVIVENSGDERWDTFINGMKQAADLQDIHLIICNTDELENAQEEKKLIQEQLDNGIDALIIQAAPGEETAAMLESTLAGEKPFVLVGNDALPGKIDEDIRATSGFAKIMPDHYEMGYRLGKEFCARPGKTVGIVCGNGEADSAKKRQSGLLKALTEAGCRVAWQMTTAYGQDIRSAVREQEAVDIVAVLENGALEQVAGLKADEGLHGAALCGIGSSAKTIYYLDAGVIGGLVMTDEYYMGYYSVIEVSLAFRQRMYTIRDHETDIRVLQKEDLFTEENQRFLHTYE